MSSRRAAGSTRLAWLVTEAAAATGRTPRNSCESKVDSYNAIPEAAQWRVLADMKDDLAKAKGMVDPLQQRALVRNRNQGLGI